MAQRLIMPVFRTSFLAPALENSGGLTQQESRQHLHRLTCNFHGNSLRDSRPRSAPCRRYQPFHRPCSLQHRHCHRLLAGSTASCGWNESPTRKDQDERQITHIHRASRSSRRAHRLTFRLIVFTDLRRPIGWDTCKLPTKAA